MNKEERILSKKEILKRHTGKTILKVTFSKAQYGEQGARYEIIKIDFCDNSSLVLKSYDFESYSSGIKMYNSL